MIYCPNCGNPLQVEGDAGNRMSCPSCGYALDGACGPAAGAQPAADSQAQGCRQPAGVEAPAPVPETDYWGTRGKAPSAVAAPVQAEVASGNGIPAAPGHSLPKAMAVAALVLGILAMVNCWVPAVNLIAVVLGAIAIALGFTARSRARRGLAAGAGMGLAGAVLGIVAVVLSLLISIGAFAVAHIVYNSGLFDDGVSRVQPMGEGAETSEPRRGADEGAWASMEFVFGDERFQLGDTELEDFEEETGWTLDLGAAGYPHGYIVQPGEEITSIDLGNAEHPDDYVYVSVRNGGNDQCDLKECELSRISVESPSGSLSCTAEGGIGLGSAVDEVLAVYGTPAHDYTSGNGSYRSLTYAAADYRKQAEFTASEGSVVDGFSMALL